MSSVTGLLAAAIEIYSLVVIARIILSWFPIAPGSPWDPVYRVVHAATEPPLAAIRSVIPPLRMGMGALDLSPIVLLLSLQLLAAVIAR
jgi:YggT family protein